MFNSKCASFHSHVHYFNMPTDKSAPNPQCLEHFSTTQHSKGTEVLQHWGVVNILPWKYASRHNGVHFSTTRLPKVLRTRCVFNITFWLQNVLRHSCVQFLISHPTRWLCICRFSEATFRPFGATKNHKTLDLEKHGVSGLFYLLAHLDLLSTYPLCSDPFLFWPFLFSDSSHHCCCICP